MSIFNDLKNKNTRSNSEANMYVSRGGNKPIYKTETYALFEKRIRECLDPLKHMSLFSVDELCDCVEKIDKQKAVKEALNSIGRVIRVIGSDEGLVESLKIYVFGVTVIDGKLTEEEWAISNPALKTLFKNEQLTYWEAKAVVDHFMGEMSASERDGFEKTFMGAAYDLLMAVGNRLVSEVLAIGLFISACDGHVSITERNFLKSVFDIE